jgi:hypothetical protein
MCTFYLLFISLSRLSRPNHEDLAIFMLFLFLLRDKRFHSMKYKVFLTFMCVCVCVSLSLKHGATYPSITHGFVSSSRFSLIALELRNERGKRKANGQGKGVVDHPPTPDPPATGLLNPHETHPGFHLTCEPALFLFFSFKGLGFFNIAKKFY